MRRKRMTNFRRSVYACCQNGSFDRPNRLFSKVAIAYPRAMQGVRATDQVSSCLRELVETRHRPLQLVVFSGPQGLRRNPFLDVRRDPFTFEIRPLPREVRGDWKGHAITVADLERTRRYEPPGGLRADQGCKAIFGCEPGDHLGGAGRMLVYQHHHLSVMSLPSERLSEDGDRPPLQREPNHQRQDLKF